VDDEDKTGVGYLIHNTIFNLPINRSHQPLVITRSRYVWWIVGTESIYTASPMTTRIGLVKYVSLIDLIGFYFVYKLNGRWLIGSVNTII
jgi:hypothetical protein